MAGSEVPKVRVKLILGHPRRFLSLVPYLLIRFYGPVVLGIRDYNASMRSLHLRHVWGDRNQWFGGRAAADGKCARQDKRQTAKGRERQPFAQHHGA